MEQEKDGNYALKCTGYTTHHGVILSYNMSNFKMDFSIKQRISGNELTVIKRNLKI